MVSTSHQIMNRNCRLESKSRINSQVEVVDDIHVHGKEVPAAHEPNTGGSIKGFGSTKKVPPLIPPLMRKSASGERIVEAW
jgi:hypothetical protein